NVLQAITAKGKDYLMKMALGNPDSVRRAIMACAIIGITLDPASKFAYLVPRDGEVKLDISYMGLMEIAVRSGSIRFARARMV
ncbi:recombinase RecT, partial [Listeria monocytogenes]|uniref:recombinase RecT n=1 Tax=Listeria monocytogenes TaxID=1639 RepID=UPI002FDC5B6A